MGHGLGTLRWKEDSVEIYMCVSELCVVLFFFVDEKNELAGGAHTPSNPTHLSLFRLCFCLSFVWSSPTFFLLFSFSFSTFPSILKQTK